MSGAWIGVLAIAAMAVGTVKATAGAMIQEEAQTRLNRVPFVLIRLASAQVPQELRADLSAEWMAELEFVLRGTEGMPLTRLWRGYCYSVGLLFSARAVTRGLTGGRGIRTVSGVEPPGQPETRSPSVQLHQSLTPRQLAILEAIRSLTLDRGYPPTMREVAEAVQSKSVSGLSYQYRLLEDKGYLRRNPRGGRTTQVRQPGEQAFPPEAGDPG